MLHDSWLMKGKPILGWSGNWNHHGTMGCYDATLSRVEQKSQVETLLRSFLFYEIVVFFNIWHENDMIWHGTPNMRFRRSSSWWPVWVPWCSIFLLKAWPFQYVTVSSEFWVKPPWIKGMSCPMGCDPPIFRPTHLQTLQTCLVGGDWNHGILFSHIYWECHHPIWRSPSFFRGVGLNYQPVMLYL